MVDLDIEDNPSENFIHYLVTNVPGTNAAAGDAIFSYIPPFTFDYVPGRVPEEFDQNSDLEHTIAILVYEQQQGEITGEQVETDICPRLLERIQVNLYLLLLISSTQFR